MRSAASTWARNNWTIGSSVATQAPTRSASVEVSIDAFARKRRALAVQRLMQQELGHQHHGQEARPGKAARDRVRRRRRFGDRLTIAAGELFAHMFDDLPAPRLAFERLRHVFPELAQPRPAALAAGARRRFDNTLDGKIVGELAWTARRPTEFLLRQRRRDNLGLRLLLAFGLLEVFDRQFELLDEKLAAL